MAVTMIEVVNEIRRLAKEGGFIGHVSKDSVDTMTDSEIMISMRKCSNEQCHCELVDQESLKKLMGLSHCINDFMCRFLNVKEAFSYISESFNDGHYQPIVFEDEEDGFHHEGS
jgi:hypothetical protein